MVGSVVCLGVSVDFRGVGLSVLFLAFDKDLNYVHHRHREATGPGDIFNCPNSPCTTQTVSLWSTHCKKRGCQVKVQQGMTKPPSQRWTGATISPFCHSLHQVFCPVSDLLTQLKLTLAQLSENVTGPPC